MVGLIYPLKSLRRNTTQGIFLNPRAVQLAIKYCFKKKDFKLGFSLPKWAFETSASHLVRCIFQ